MAFLSIWEPLEGRTPLWKVFWVYGFAANFVYALISLVVPVTNPGVLRLYLIAGLILGMYQLLALWKCAFNCRTRSLGVFIRISVIGSLMLLPVFIYLIVMQPLLFAL